MKAEDVIRKQLALVAERRQGMAFSEPAWDELYAWEQALRWVLEETEDSEIER